MPRFGLADDWVPDGGLVNQLREVGAEYAVDAWKLLRAAVAIDSSPDDPHGLERVVSVVAPAFASLGLATSIERTADGHPVLHARR